MLTPELGVQAVRTRLMKDGEEGQRPTETKQGNREEKRHGEKERAAAGVRDVDECVSPIVFSWFPPSNKSFKRGIKKKSRGEMSRGLNNVLYSTAANYCFLQ